MVAFPVRPDKETFGIQTLWDLETLLYLCRRLYERCCVVTCEGTWRISEKNEFVKPLIVILLQDFIFNFKSIGKHSDSVVYLFFQHKKMLTYFNMTMKWLANEDSSSFICTWDVYADLALSTTASHGISALTPGCTPPHHPNASCSPPNFHSRVSGPYRRRSSIWLLVSRRARRELWGVVCGCPWSLYCRPRSGSGGGGRRGLNLAECIMLIVSNPH